MRILIDNDVPSSLDVDCKLEKIFKIRLRVYAVFPFQFIGVIQNNARLSQERAAAICFFDI